MKKIIVSLALAFIASIAIGQDMKKFNLYKPEEDASKAIASAVKEAKAAGKNVFIQIGGNWCIWCARFHDLVTTDKQVDSAMKANFIVYHMNYSKENKNEELLKRYGYPQRFGFPVFLVLDSSGKLIHTQNSAYLEGGKDSNGYNVRAVIDFLNDWGPSAFDAAKYKEQ